jgi:hypothetical protein
MKAIAEFKANGNTLILFEDEKDGVLSLQRNGVTSATFSKTDKVYALKQFRQVVQMLLNSLL